MLAQKRRGVATLIIAAAWVLLTGSNAAVAQTANATLLGTVTDEQHQVIPGATVTVTNVDTGRTREVISDADGRYRAAALAPGAYQITVHLDGFATLVRTGLTLTVGQEASVDVTLKVASVSETVTVSAAAPIVDVSTTQIGTVIDNGELNKLPVLGRDFNSLAVLAPGIAAVGGGAVSAGGQREVSNTFLLDGMNNDAPNLGGPRGAVSLEAVREFVVIANQFSAEYGQAAGGIISAVTRSGTNNLEGRLFLFHRNKKFDAQSPFATGASAPFSEERYGGFLGGPIVRDRIHYFVTEEGDRIRDTAIITAPVVPVSEREVPNPFDGHQPFARLDAHLTDAQSLWLRYRLDRQNQSGNGIGGLNTRSRGTNRYLSNQDITVNHTTIMGSRGLNEARFSGGLRHLLQDGVGFADFTQPTISRPSGNLGPASNANQETIAPTFILTDNFSYTPGAHSFKFGAELQLYKGHLDSPINGNGTFTFRTDTPFDPAVTSTYPTQYTQSIIPDYPRGRVELPNEAYVLFAQDSWRVAPNLTLNLGLRYDTDNAWKDITGLAIDDRANFAPRIGFAWDPRGDKRTAVHGGFGVYVDQGLLNLPLNVARRNVWKDIIITNPGYPDPYSRPGVFVGPVGTTVSQSLRTPETRSATLGMKREIAKGYALSVDGVYTRGFNEQYSVDLNSPVNGVRPNPNFARIDQYTTDGAETWYSALLVGFERRGAGPAYGVSYTLAKALSVSEGQGSQPQDGLHIDLEKGPSANDRRHQVVGHLSWELPGDFAVAAIVQARSGTPVNIITGIDNNANTVINDRPDLVDANGDPFSKATYFTAFTGRVGNLTRNSARGPAFATLDLRVTKILRLGGYRSEVFVEAFNVTNRVNLNSPNGNLTSATFGQSSGLVGNMRQIEFGFRYDFPRRK